MTTDNCPLVLIRWLDSRQPTSAWRYLADVGEPKAVECASVGWLLKDDADVKVVCQSVGDLEDPENAQASGVMTIPTRCVVSIERLEDVDERIKRMAKNEKTSKRIGTIASKATRGAPLTKSERKSLGASIKIKGEPAGTLLADNARLLLEQAERVASFR